MTLGQRITMIRKQKGLSQRALARIAGINISTMNRIEFDMHDFHISNLIKIIKALKVTPNDILDINYEQPSPYSQP